MKTLNQNKGIMLLSGIREKFRARIETEFESSAKDCLTCEVKGSCCTDAHFVNVQITRLAAAAIGEAIDQLPQALQKNIFERNLDALDELSDEDNSNRTFSCPLFEKGIGCLVHNTAKPLPCINHACYENKSDLPPSELLSDAEGKISHLNDRVYRKSWQWRPIPEWIARLSGELKTGN